MNVSASHDASMSDAAARLDAMIDELRTDRLLLTPLTLDHVDAYYRVYVVEG